MALKSLVVADVEDCGKEATQSAERVWPANVVILSDLCCEKVRNLRRMPQCELPACVKKTQRWIIGPDVWMPDQKREELEHQCLWACQFSDVWDLGKGFNDQDPFLWAELL